MEYENVRMPELKSLARDRGLRSYSRMRKTEDADGKTRTRNPWITNPVL